ncbi:hypothetical protein M231_00439 [Tremella mesenterica]|uniref:Uncharacterized protein n=1 Tax=Tremella mesenterica TaxID=5217 RepID=A0A4Q1BVK9_TREME|nr:hypothetical protein M231_00439 [Tremella mesenterica]
MPRRREHHQTHSTTSQQTSTMTYNQPEWFTEEQDQYPTAPIKGFVFVSTAPLQSGSFHDFRERHEIRKSLKRTNTSQYFSNEDITKLNESWIQTEQGLSVLTGQIQEDVWNNTKESLAEFCRTLGQTYGDLSDGLDNVRMEMIQNGQSCHRGLGALDSFIDEVQEREGVSEELKGMNVDGLINLGWMDRRDERWEEMFGVFVSMWTEGSLVNE